MDRALSANDILQLTKGKTNIIVYPELYKAKNIDELLTPYGCCVILYMSAQNYGHWVCLIKNKNTLEFFCSYGMMIDDQLLFIPKDFANQTHQNYPYLTKLIAESRYRLSVNTKQIQAYDEKVASCGRHVALRILYRKVPLNKYLKLMQDQADVMSLVLTDSVRVL
jgi:hypothetical protein